MVKTGRGQECYDAVNAALVQFANLLNEKNRAAEITRKHLSINVLSDSFVIAYDKQAVIDEEKVDEGTVVWRFVILISYLIQDCFRKIKLPLRGALVIGEHFQKELNAINGNTFIFSPALCRAYELCEQVAGVPLTFPQSYVPVLTRVFSAV